MHVHMHRHENHVKEVTDFALKQPEAAVVRHDLEDVYGPAATPEFIEEYERAIREREAKKAETIRKNREANAKAKARAEAVQKKKRKKRKKGLAKEEI